MVRKDAVSLRRRVLLLHCTARNSVRLASDWINRKNADSFPRAPPNQVGRVSQDHGVLRPYH